MFCSNCSKEIFENSNFCNSCGAKINDALNNDKNLNEQKKQNYPHQITKKVRLWGGIIVLIFFVLGLIGNQIPNDNEYKDISENPKNREEPKKHRPTEEEIHKEHMDYIRYCAATGNYVECMSKRPEIK